MEPENLLLFLCGFLISAAAVYRYTRSFIIPGVTIMMFLGALSVLIPVVHNELDKIYNFTEDKLPDLILLVFLPILIFESGRKLKLRDIKSEIIPIGFFCSSWSYCVYFHSRHMHKYDSTYQLYGWSAFWVYNSFH